jgi:hypothetical protein
LVQSVEQATAVGLLGVSITGGNGSYTYRWQQSTDKTTWHAINQPQATAGYAPPALYDTTYYRCEVSCLGTTTTSALFTVNVYPPFTAGYTGDYAWVFAGEPIPLIKSTPSTGGNCNERLYQWQKMDADNTWQDIPEATGVTYQPATELAALFRRRVTLPCTGEILYSNPVKFITVGAISGTQRLTIEDLPQPLTSIVPIQDSRFT